MTICRDPQWYTMKCIHISQRCISSRQMTDNIFEIENKCLDTCYVHSTRISYPVDWYYTRVYQRQSLLDFPCARECRIIRVHLPFFAKDLLRQYHTRGICRNEPRTVPHDQGRDEMLSSERLSIAYDFRTYLPLTPGRDHLKELCCPWLPPDVFVCVCWRSRSGCLIFSTFDDCCDSCFSNNGSNHWTEEKSGTTHTRSSVFVPELDLIHYITVHDRLFKVRLIRWRRFLTRDWHKRSVSVGKKKKRRPVIVISVTECDEETVVSRRDYAAVYFLDLSRLIVNLCAVFLINVSYQAANLEKTISSSEERDVVFCHQDLYFTVVEPMITSTRYTVAETTRNQSSMHFSIMFPCLCFSTDPLSDDFFIKWELTISIWRRKSSR